MSTNKIPREVVQERERFCWELRTEHWMTHQRIADSWNAAHPGHTITRKGVTHLLKRVYNRNVKIEGEDRAQKIAEQEEVLNKIVREALAAWEQSKKPVESSVTEKIEGEEGFGTGKGAGGKKMRAQIRRHDANGNPAFLNLAMQALGDIRKLRGMDIQRTMNIDLQALDNEQLERIAAGEDPLNVIMAKMR